MRPKMDGNSDFCSLGRFLEIPIGFYSAGLLVRRAFPLARPLEPEILLVDEVLSAGDAAFQEKARKRMRDMLSRARIIVVVSHDLETLARICETGLWLDKGRVRLLGPMED